MRIGIKLGTIVKRRSSDDDEKRNQRHSLYGRLSLGSVALDGTAVLSGAIFIGSDTETKYLNAGCRHVRVRYN